MNLLVRILPQILPLLVPLILKTIPYLLVFRLRGAHITIVSSIIIASAPIIFKGVIPIPLPYVGEVVSFVIAIYLCAQYTTAELYPDIIATVCGIEIFAILIQSVFFSWKLFFDKKKVPHISARDFFVLLHHLKYVTLQAAPLILAPAYVLIDVLPMTVWWKDRQQIRTPS